MASLQSSLLFFFWLAYNDGSKKQPQRQISKMELWQIKLKERERHEECNKYWSRLWQETRLDRINDMVLSDIALYKSVIIFGHDSQ